MTTASPWSSCSRSEWMHKHKRMSQVCVQLLDVRWRLCVCRLLQDILRYIHSVARCVEENAGKPTAKFWRVLLNKAYDVLDKVRIHTHSQVKGTRVQYILKE